MISRHALLYDVERWRSWRTWLLLPATVCLLVAIFVPTLKGQQVPTLTSLLGAFLYALAASLWARKRFSSIGVDGEDLVIRVFLNRARVPLGEVRSAKVAPLASRFGRPDRRRALPRPSSRWLEREAAIIRLDSEPKRLIKLSRLLGARCLDGRDLVVPVPDPGLLVSQIEQGRPGRPQPGRTRRRGR